MLLISFIQALIGVGIAAPLVYLCHFFEVTGIPVVLVWLIALTLFLFLSDVVEDALIKKFNQMEDDYPTD